MLSKAQSKKERAMKFSAIALLATACCLLASCRSGVPEPKVPLNMQLRSDSFSPGQPIPDKYSAYGASVSPQLTWSNIPDRTKSFVLLVEDPDAPKATPFVHWLAYDIPASEISIAEGQQPQGTPGKNDRGSTSYYGPKPPSGTHHYHFKIFALDAQLSLPSGADKDAVMKAMAGHTLGEAELIGTYGH